MATQFQEAQDKDLELQEFIKDLEESKRKIDLSIRELQEMRCML